MRQAAENITGGKPRSSLPEIMCSYILRVVVKSSRNRSGNLDNAETVLAAEPGLFLRSVSQSAANTIAWSFRNEL